MIYTRLIMIALIVLMFIYYAMVIGQLSGWWKITNRKMKFVNLCVSILLLGLFPRILNAKKKEQFKELNSEHLCLRKQIGKSKISAIIIAVNRSPLFFLFLRYALSKMPTSQRTFVCQMPVTGEYVVWTKWWSAVARPLAPFREYSKTFSQIEFSET